MEPNNSDPTFSWLSLSPILFSFYYFYSSVDCGGAESFKNCFTFVKLFALTLTLRNICTDSESSLLRLDDYIIPLDSPTSYPPDDLADGE